MVDESDSRLVRLQQAVVELEASIREFGVELADQNVADWYDVERLELEVLSHTSIEFDPVRQQGERAVAITRSLLGVVNDAVQGRGTAAGRTCLRKLPGADMHQISNDAGAYWICDHAPSHVER